jgi:hypothetical protein
VLIRGFFQTDKLSCIDDFPGYPERTSVLDFVGHNTDYSRFYSQYGTSIIGQGAFSRIVIPT